MAHFGPDPGAPGAARRFVSDALRRWGHSGSLVRDAQLVVSDEKSGLRVSVRDASPVHPTLREPAPMAPSGRGLQLVAALAARWGTQIEADGKTIWAVFQT